MFVKISTIFLTALIAGFAEGTAWDSLVVSWGRNASTRFYNLALEINKAKSEGWTSTCDFGFPAGVTPMSYYGDVTFVILFVDGKARGFQIAFPVSAVANSQSSTKFERFDTVITKICDKISWYTATVYFYNDQSTDTRKIWLQKKNGLQEIPTIKSELLKKTDYSLKKCIPTMGTHYYTWHPQSDCTILFPWFLLSNDDRNIVGMGFQALGNLKARGKRPWWETLPAGALSAAMADPPTCGPDAIAKYGIISLHVWFIKNPHNIRC